MRSLERRGDDRKPGKVGRIPSEGCFLTFLVEKTGESRRTETSRRPTQSGDSIGRRCNFFRQLRVVIQHQWEDSGVGNRTIELGNETPARKPGQRIVETPAGTHRLTKARPRVSEAMAQQCGDFGRGNQSSPQKLLQLVGCRDPNARPEPWVRPRPAPVKR